MAANDKMTTLEILQGIRDWCDAQLATKQGNLTFDTAPTQSSTNPVTSGGIYLSLLNYYLKTETYTKAEVNALIEAIKQFTYTVVQSLPDPPSADTMNVIYLVPSPNPQTQNAKDEYITVRSGSSPSYTYAWEQIGSTELDLSDYPEFEETSDPSDADLIDEYTRVLTSLYQAITDAQTATANAKADYVGDDNYIYHWNASAGAYQKTSIYVKGDPGTTDYNQLQNKPSLKPVATSGSYNDLTSKPTIPDELADLQSDSDHRTVSDSEKATWGGKQDAINDLSTIRSGAQAGATAYQKPQGGIPESDCDFSVMEWEENDDPCSLLS